MCHMIQLEGIQLALNNEEESEDDTDTESEEDSKEESEESEDEEQDETPPLMQLGAVALNSHQQWNKTAQSYFQPKNKMKKKPAAYDVSKHDKEDSFGNNTFELRIRVL